MAQTIQFKSNSGIRQAVYSIPKLKLATNYYTTMREPKYYLSPLPIIKIAKVRSEALAKNLYYASAAVEYVNQKILYCDTFPSRLKGSCTPEEFSDAMDSVTSLREDPLEGEDKIEAILKHKAGNCDEMSSLAVSFLKTRFGVDSESFTISNGDHVFVVIGRDFISDPKDFETWGTNAVVCDVWAHSFYPASNMNQYLCNYVRTEIASGLPIVERFSPWQHRITPHSKDMDIESDLSESDISDSSC